MLLEGLKALSVDKWPPKVMLHSYGASVEMVPEFAKLPRGKDSIGSADDDQRVFFSFSAAIVGGSPEKLMARIEAVPDNRILIETDLTAVSPMNGALEEIVHIVAAAKSWTVADTVKQTWANFCSFYKGYL
jgi:Tat protein secretion system quality control protein TatD with DNase activity